MSNLQSMVQNSTASLTDGIHFLLLFTRSRHSEFSSFSAQS
ncbi:hypothetical protein F385_1501 [Pantoea agglomerans 299R]|nr:hypothetical protein F385_1501 [Pantoea agglomerans 299R]